MHDADLVHFRFPYDAISFPSCYNLTWELGQTRCSCSNSTHRCSSSEPKHRHWSRCSHYQQQQGFQQYLFIFAHALRKLYSPIWAWGVAVLPTARFRFHAACGCSVSASRLNDHRTIGCRVGRIIGSEGRPGVRVRMRHSVVREQSRNTDNGAEVRTTNNNRDKIGCYVCIVEPIIIKQALAVAASNLGWEHGVLEVLHDVAFLFAGITDELVVIVGGIPACAGVDAFATYHLWFFFSAPLHLIQNGPARNPSAQRNL